MAGKRPPIGRRIVPPESDTGVVIFRDPSGAKLKSYDLKALGLPADITAIFCAAFAGHYATKAPDTRRSCWGCLRTLSGLVAQDGLVCSAIDLTTAMIGRYQIWLDLQKTQLGASRTKTAKQHHLSVLRQLIDWTKRHHPNRLPARIDFPYNPYPNRASQPRPCLSATQLKVILRACYEEIDDAWARFQTGQKILTSTGPVEGVDPRLCDCVRSMAAIGDGVMPTTLELIARKIGLGPVARQGGLRVATSYLHLAPEKLAAFFIAIAIQTAANPDPLRRLVRDCQVLHPLDESRVTIDWDKARAGGKMKRAQRRSFDCRRPYSAPILIERLLAMSEPLLAQAEPQCRDKLFLLKSEKTNQVTEVPMGTLGGSVKRFIKRANARIAIWNEAAPERPRDSLPNFVAAFLRGSVATEHYKSSGGDILEVQAILNHKNAHTSDTYVRGPDVLRIQAETIARLQGLMIAWVTSSDVPSSEPQPVIGRATVPFGHDCLNPLAGIAVGSHAGKVCPHFGGCLRCPCLVIPLDAAHLAGILRAKTALEAARLRLDPKRWAVLYAPSYRILVDEILPDFAGALYAEAQLLMVNLPQLPVIE